MFCAHHWRFKTFRLFTSIHLYICESEYMSSNICVTFNSWDRRLSEHITNIVITIRGRYGPFKSNKSQKFVFHVLCIPIFSVRKTFNSYWEFDCVCVYTTKCRVHTCQYLHHCAILCHRMWLDISFGGKCDAMIIVLYSVKFKIE